MERHEVLEIIEKPAEEILIKGVTIKESQMCKELSDIELSEEIINNYSNSLHNFLKAKGTEETKKKILIILRINPYVAIRITESCSLVGEMYKLFYPIGVILDNIRSNKAEDVILNDSISNYMTMLTEAAYRNSVIEYTRSEYKKFTPGSVLDYMWKEDSKELKKSRPSIYLKRYNIRHILNHIPSNQQIEFINWFWGKHCHAAKAYNIRETLASKLVEMMLEELEVGSIWHHVENYKNITPLEQRRIEQERKQIRSFVKATMYEKNHLHFLERILGSDNYDEKLVKLMGQEFVDEYYESQKLESQYKVKDYSAIMKKRRKLCEEENVKLRTQRKSEKY